MAAMATAAIREAQHLATRLAAFFPERSRWRWQAAFLNEALGASGSIRQRQRGGRKAGQSLAKRNELLALAEEFLNTQAGNWDRHERQPTQEEFAQERGVSVRKLRRALKLHSEIQKGGVKETT